MTEENATPETEAEFDARMRAGLGLDTPTQHIGQPKSFGTADYTASPVGQPTPPTWDVLPSARPANYSSALAELEAASDRVNELLSKLHALESGEQQSHRDLESAAVAADAAGKAFTVPKSPRDFARERVALLAQHKARKLQHQTALTGYRAAVRAEGPTWQAALQAAVEPARQAALEALDSRPAAEASRLEREWLTLVTASSNLWQELHPSKPAPRRAKTTTTGGSLTRGLAESRTLLNSDDDALTGTWMADRLEPPRHVRRAMADGHHHEVLQLLEIEQGEDFKVTDYTHAYAKEMGYLGGKGSAFPGAPGAFV